MKRFLKLILILAVMFFVLHRMLPTWPISGIFQLVVLIVLIVDYLRRTP